jgi:hypothetical protein
MKPTIAIDILSTDGQILFHIVGELYQSERIFYAPTYYYDCLLIMTGESLPIDDPISIPKCMKGTISN